VASAVVMTLLLVVSAVRAVRFTGSELECARGPAEPKAEGSG
jgi:hypothetical protein